jgi:hypothetical protein
MLAAAVLKRVERLRSLAAILYQAGERTQARKVEAALSILTSFSVINHPCIRL